MYVCMQTHSLASFEEVEPHPPTGHGQLFVHLTLDLAQARLSVVALTITTRHFINETVL